MVAHLVRSFSSLYRLIFCAPAILLAILSLAAISTSDVSAQAPQSGGPEGIVDCVGVPNGSAVDDGCGCGKPGKNECLKCDGDLSCIDCAGIPFGTSEDSGCGCNQPAPSACGCGKPPSNRCNRCDGVMDCVDCAGIPFGTTTDLGCGCGVPPNGSGCCGGAVNVGCGCGAGYDCMCPWSRFDIYRYRGRFNVTVTRSPFVPPCLEQLLYGTPGREGAVSYCSRTDRSGGKNCLAKAILGPAFRGGKDVQFMLFDRACNRVQVPASLAAKIPSHCMAGWADTASPISLILGPGDENDGTFVATQFPLDPTKRDAWYVWRASARAPLLVSDPRHTGKITSAYQLFGEWAFGGPRVAKLADVAMTESTPNQNEKWENGYEALATLDTDGDKKISGKELESLALWFDENRNGVSDEGEVRLLSTEGITALWYSPDRANTDTKSVYATKGYERTVNGKSEIGMSVDWYGRSGKSKEELISQEGVFPIAGENLSDREAALKAIPQLSGAAEGNRIDDPLNGLWTWNFSDNTYGGMLGLFVTDRDQLSGFSVSPMNLSDEGRAKAGADSGHAIFPINGIVTRAPNAVISKFSFTIQGNDKSRTVTEVEVSADGTTLLGRSRVVSEMTGMKDAPLIYTWSARKVTSPQQPM